MDFTVGSIYEGKVTGITGFGAFVQLAPGKSGMVHISEIANTFVDDIKKHIKEGDIVKVKLIGIDQNGRINLSIKKALPASEKPPPMGLCWKRVRTVLLRISSACSCKGVNQKCLICVCRRTKEQRLGEEDRKKRSLDKAALFFLHITVKKGPPF